MLNNKKMIRNAADIATIESDGLDAYLPHQTPFELIEASAACGPDRLAVRYIKKVDTADTDLTLTYSEFARRIRQAANLFRRLDIGEKEAVAILAPHALSTQIALWGAELAGRACPINPMLGARAHSRAAQSVEGEGRSRIRGEQRYPTVVEAGSDAPGCRLPHSYSRL